MNARSRSAPLVYKRPQQVYVPNTGDTPEQRLSTLQAALTEATEKLEMAYDAAEVGEAIDLVLEHLSESLLPIAVQRMLGEAPTAVDALATYDAMFLPLALLEGAIALSSGTVIHGALVEAFLLFDWAQTECGDMELKGLLPDDPASEATTPAQEDYRERDESAFPAIAELLHEARLTKDDRASCDSDRLLRIAAAIAERHKGIPPIPDQGKSIASDIAALIKASRLVRGNAESPARTELIRLAGVHINHLVDEPGDILAPDLVETGCPASTQMLGR